MTQRSRQQAGFTFIEVAISLVIFTIVVWIMTALLTTTSGLSKTSRVNTRAAAEHRRNLESLSSVLRTADIRSLVGFDIDGRATEPTFNRVTGIDMVDRVFAPPERIVWRASPTPVNGVPNAGALWLMSDTEESLVANRVPSGGFELRQEGSVLAIRLTTYYATDSDHVTSITSESAVTLRN